LSIELLEERHMLSVSAVSNLNDGTVAKAGNPSGNLQAAVVGANVNPGPKGAVVGSAAVSPAYATIPTYVGLYNPQTSVFYLKNGDSAGNADITFPYGPANSGWEPIAGDWANNGEDTIGLYNPTTSVFYLRNTNNSGYADLTFQYGTPNCDWIPIAGNWNGGNIVTVGLYDPTTSNFYLRDTNSAGYADMIFQYGPPNSGWVPIVGDWTDDGTDTIGLYNPTTSVFYLRNSNSAGNADITFAYGPANSGMKPITGDWDQGGVTAIGLYNPTTSVFYLRDSNNAGYANLTFQYGPANSGWIPIVGDWIGNTYILPAAGGAVVAAPDTTPLTNAAFASTNAALQPLVTKAIAPTQVVDEKNIPTGSDQLKAIDPQVVDGIDLTTVVEHKVGHVVGLNGLDDLTDNVASSVLGGSIR
jgi:predicted Zn-dependent protease